VNWSTRCYAAKTKRPGFFLPTGGNIKAGGRRRFGISFPSWRERGGGTRAQETEVEAVVRAPGNSGFRPSVLEASPASSVSSDTRDSEPDLPVRHLRSFFLRLSGRRVPI